MGPGGAEDCGKCAVLLNVFAERFLLPNGFEPVNCVFSKLPDDSGPVNSVSSKLPEDSRPGISASGAAPEGVSDR